MNRTRSASTIKKQKTMKSWDARNILTRKNQNGKGKLITDAREKLNANRTLDAREKIVARRKLSKVTTKKSSQQKSSISDARNNILIKKKNSKLLISTRKSPKELLTKRTNLSRNVVDSRSSMQIPFKTIRNDATTNVHRFLNSNKQQPNFGRLAVSKSIQINNSNMIPSVNFTPTAGSGFYSDRPNPPLTSRIKNPKQQLQKKQTIVKTNSLSQLPTTTLSINNSSEGFRVIVSNLHPSVTEEDVVELFGIIGPMKRARLAHSGVAEVVFVKKSDALASIRKYNLRELDGRPMKVVMTSTPSPVKSSFINNNRNFPATLSESEEAIDPRMLQSALFKNSSNSRPVTFTVKM